MKINKVLAIGAHPDDISLYCGGTLLKLKDGGSKIYHLICTCGESKGGSRLQENADACNFLKVSKNFVLRFSDSCLEHNKQLVSAIDAVISEVRPSWIFTHSVSDYHQDHIAVAKATRSANRKQRSTLITYPSYNLTIPFEANLFVDIDDYFDKKMELLKIFESQAKEWYMQSKIIEARSLGTNMAVHVEKFKIELMRL